MSKSNIGITGEELKEAEEAYKSILEYQEAYFNRQKFEEQMEKLEELRLCSQKENDNEIENKTYSVNLIHVTEIKVVAENEEEAKKLVIDQWKEISQHSGVLEIDDIQCIGEEEAGHER